MKKYMKKNLVYLKDFIKEEYKFLIGLLIITIIALYPVNYYIVVGGGIKNIGKRVKVDNAYKEKGTFNISYVSELDGTVSSYLLSYIIPSWTREKVDSYKYTEDESMKDLNTRNIIYLNQSSNNAIYNAYTLANKKVTLKSKKIYILTKFPELENPFEVGDEILEFNNNEVNSVDDIRNEINKKNKDDTIKVKIKRDKHEKNIDVKVYENEEKQKVIGIVATIVNEYNTDPKVNINFAVKESGPSGGIITALSIYNKLVPEDITKGYTIAGTGTMEEDGTVGTIGGIEHKLIGANKKVDYFIVPAGKNYKEAKKAIKKYKLKIKLIKVKSLQDAINKLNELK